jgi:hypothetical protein
VKDDLNDEVQNGTPKTLFFSNGVLNWNGGNKPKGDHVTIFLSYIKRLIT